MLASSRTHAHLLTCKFSTACSRRWLQLRRTRYAHRPRPPRPPHVLHLCLRHAPASPPHPHPLPLPAAANPPCHHLPDHLLFLRPGCCLPSPTSSRKLVGGGHVSRRPSRFRYRGRPPPVVCLRARVRAYVIAVVNPFCFPSPSPSLLISLFSIHQSTHNDAHIEHPSPLCLPACRLLSPVRARFAPSPLPPRRKTVKQQQGYLPSPRPRPPQVAAWTRRGTRRRSVGRAAAGKYSHISMMAGWVV